MLAIAAAVAFGLALLWDLLDVAAPGDAFTYDTLLLVGLLLMALHLAGVGTRVRSRR